jgi:SpoIID/LytB domain protein
MKKLFFILFSFFIVVALVLFFPRSVEHGVIVGRNSDKLVVIVGNKTKSFKTSSDFPKLTVVNFKYNVFKAFSFSVIPEITERIMMKNGYFYDLELSGKTKLDNKAHYYSIDKDNNLELTDNKSIIVGKTNVKAYKNKSGNLKTFLVSPMDYKEMRVGITTTNFASMYHDRSIIKCEAPAKLYSLREDLEINLPEGSVILIEKAGTNLRLIASEKAYILKSRIYLKGQGLTLQNISRGTPEAFNPSYNGVLEFNVLENGLNIVNEVSLEDYLKKVVPSEMPASGGLEALKCQAVAARTYAIADMLLSRFADFGFYVDDSTRSQVYNNIETNPLSTQSVEETTGLILTYNGEPIEAKYYSTSAGTGVNYKDVWFFPDGTSDNRPYITTGNYTTPETELPKTEDEWLSFYKDLSIKAIDSDSPYFRWKTEYSKSGLTTALSKTLNNLYSGEKTKKYMSIYEGSKEVKIMPQLSSLEDIKITKRSEGGIAIEIAYVFSNATIYVRSDGYIRNSLRIHSDYTNELAQLIRHKGKPISNSGSIPSAFFSVEKLDDKFILYGGGYGHGAGMSQYGAMGLSKQGKKFDEILKVFYKDVKLQRIY